jgi:hypothetical protein
MSFLYEKKKMLKEKTEPTEKLNPIEWGQNEKKLFGSF